MKLSRRILLAPAVAVAFLLAFGAIAFRALRVDQAALGEIFATRFTSFQETSTAAARVDSSHASVYRLVTWIGNYDEARVAASTNEITRAIDAAANAFAQLAVATRLTPEEKTSLDAIQADLEAYRKHVATALDLATVDVNTGLAALQTADTSYLALKANVDVLVERQKVLARERYEGAVTVYRRTTVLASLLAVVVSTLLAGVTTRIVTGQLGGEPEYAAAVARRVADGDLASQIEGRAADSSVLAAMKLMIERLGDVVGQVRGSAARLAEASRQVSSTAQIVSQGTSEQAASVEETTSSLEQMSASITQTAANSRETERVSTKGARDASQACSAVQQTLDAMRSIAGRITIVEEIAYQTNLLALNAAIEAARAGDHGKAAAKEIGKLSGESVAVAERSSALLQELAPAIARAAELVQDQVTQRNAAAAEELRSTAEEVASAAAMLSRHVSYFSLEAHEGS